MEVIRTSHEVMAGTDVLIAFMIDAARSLMVCAEAKESSEGPLRESAPLTTAEDAVGLG
jgi:hypothetical protein